MVGVSTGPRDAGEEWSTVSSREAYASVRRNLADLLRGTRECGELPVAACPGWNVRDTVLHLVEICRTAEDRLNPGRAGKVGRSADGLSDLGLESLLAEWTRSGERVDSALARAGHLHRGAVMAMDAFTHEWDIRLALGAPIPVGHPAFRGAFEVVVGGLSGSVMVLGLPSFHLETDAGRWIVGDGEPAAVVHGSKAELYRSMTGRRTYTQIERLTWSTDPSPWLPAFRWGPFRPPDKLVE